MPHNPRRTTEDRNKSVPQAHYHSPKLTARIIVTAWSTKHPTCTEEAGRGASDKPGANSDRTIPA